MNKVIVRAVYIEHIFNELCSHRFLLSVGSKVTVRTLTAFHYCFDQNEIRWGRYSCINIVASN